MGKIIEFKPRRQDAGYTVLRCPLCDVDQFNVFYSHGKPYFRCLVCYTIFPEWPQEGKPA